LLLSLAAAATVVEGLRLTRGLPAAGHPATLTCRATATESCTLSGLATGKSNLLYPDPTTSQTRCLFSSSPEFAFQVVPRNPDRFLLHFQGGGACWSEFTTLTMRACEFDRVVPYDIRSIFNGSSPDNPFKDYTVVVVPACSGDLHVGNVTRSYKDLNGVPVEQRGYYNTRAVLDWVKANTAGRRLSSFLITGESAGGIGVQVWAPTLLSELSYEKAAVVIDSYVGVFPSGFEGSIVSEFGVCETGLFKRQHLQDSCYTNRTTVADALDAAIEAFPRVVFAMINSKYDETQQMFYNVAAMTSGRRKTDDIAYNRDMLAILRRHNRFPNFVSYLVTSRQHVFTTSLPFRRISNESSLSLVLQTTLEVTQQDKQMKAENLISVCNGLLDWLAQLPLSEGGSIQSHCDLLDEEHQRAANRLPEKDFCDRSLVDKTFTNELA